MDEKHNGSDDDTEDWENVQYQRNNTNNSCNNRTQRRGVGGAGSNPTHSTVEMTTNTNHNKTSLTTTSWWNQYQQYVMKHQSILYLYDDILSRLLLLFPLPNPDNINGSGPILRWREVLYGCLELHRILLQIAITSSSSPSASPLDHVESLHLVPKNIHGATTTMGTDDSTTTTTNKDSNEFVTTKHLRLVLTILQSIYPLSQELIRTFSIVLSNQNHNNNSIPFLAIISYRQAVVRRYMEWTRFVIRITMLLRYWKRVLARPNCTTPTKPSVLDDDQSGWCIRRLPGLMRHGGSLYNHYTPYDSNDGHTPAASAIVYNTTGRYYEQEWQQRVERNNNYIGKRTGRRILSTTNTAQLGHITHEASQFTPFYSPSGMLHVLQRKLSAFNTSKTVHLVRIIFGELMYVCRPVVQAESEVRILRAVRYETTALNNRNRPLLQSWAVCLVMDVISLLSLNTITNEQNGNQRQQPQRQPFYTNPASVQELQRRRMRLWLYLLRAPIWEMYTEGTIQRFSDILYRLPLLGGLLRNYIYDYIYYWKFHRAEEG